MSRHFAPIDVADLMTKFKALGKDNDPYAGPDDFSMSELLDKIGKDIKVSFCTENSEYERDNHDKSSLLGLQSLPNGLNFIGCSAGGDWESPVFFIVYFDGKKLRAYIPTEGNPWNTDTKQAYGNDEESDTENMAKRGFPVNQYLPFDWMKISIDIADRITLKK